MGTQRASNKDILDAINALTAAIAANVAQPVAVATAELPMSSATNVAPTPPKDTSIEVDEGYKQIMFDKAQAHANGKQVDVTLYARRNKHQETKLAYALTERFVALKDNGMIGAIATFAPEA